MDRKVEQAVQAFYSVEQAQLLLDKRTKVLNQATLVLAADGTDEDQNEYYGMTSEILVEFAAKRKKAGLE